MDGTSKEQLAQSQETEKPGKWAAIKARVGALFGNGNQVKQPEDVGLSRSAAAQPEELAGVPGVPPVIAAGSAK